MAPRYIVLAFTTGRMRNGPVFELGTEEPESLSAWAAREFPTARILIRDTYAGTTEVHRDWAEAGVIGQLAKIRDAFLAWADFAGQEPDFMVSCVSGHWSVMVPIGGGHSTYDVRATTTGFEFVEVAS
jgi:hypothetical protein